MVSADTKTTRSRPSRRRVAIGAAAGLLAAGALAPVGVAFGLEQTAANNIVQKPLLPSQAGLGPSVARPASAGDALNILLVGNKVDGQQAASIVMAHISGDRERVDLVRFPRDLTMGGDTLGATYTADGSPALVRSLENSLNVPIDNVAELDANGVKGMVDALGGVELAGAGFVDGDGALNYLSQGSGSGVSPERQDAVLRGILVKLAEPSTLANPSTLSSFTDAATRGVTTDESFDASDIRNLALSLRDVRANDIGSVTASPSALPTIEQALENDNTAALTN